LHNVGNLRVSGVDSRGYGPTFNVGDVVGCGWDIRGKSLYYTLNGQYLGSAFSNVRYLIPSPSTSPGPALTLLAATGDRPFVSSVRDTRVSRSRSFLPLTGVD
jgi:hypothetical protein